MTKPKNYTDHIFNNSFDICYCMSNHTMLMEKDVKFSDDIVASRYGENVVFSLRPMTSIIKISSSVDLVYSTNTTPGALTNTISKSTLLSQYAESQIFSICRLSWLRNIWDAISSRISNVIDHTNSWSDDTVVVDLWDDVEGKTVAKILTDNYLWSYIYDNYEADIKFKCVTSNDGLCCRIVYTFDGLIFAPISTNKYNVIFILVILVYCIECTHRGEKKIFREYDVHEAYLPFHLTNRKTEKFFRPKFSSLTG